MVRLIAETKPSISISKKSLWIRCTQYDFMDIFMVPMIHDKNASHPALMWNEDQYNMCCIGTWSPLITFPYSNIVLIRDVLKMIKWAAFGHSLSFTSLLLLNFVRELTQNIRTYMHIIKEEIMFFLSCDTIRALRKYLKLFEDPCLQTICCKNVTVAENATVNLCLWLNEVSVLTYEIVVDVLTGLTNCSVPDIVKLFNFLLQQAKMKALDTVTHEGNTLEQIKVILSKAVDVCHSLCTADKWHVGNKSSRHFNVVCWNCEKEGCSVNKHPQQKDQKKIAANKKKFFRAKAE